MAFLVKGINLHINILLIECEVFKILSVFLIEEIIGNKTARKMSSDFLTINVSQIQSPPAQTHPPPANHIPQKS